MNLFNNLRFHLAIIFGKTAQSSLKLFGSGANALPGLISQKIYPDIIAQLSQDLDDVILVTATNGKTTTCRLISNILQEAHPGKSFIHNRSGSNMTRGHISAFLELCTFSGKLKTNQALLEVDEAVLPQTIKETKPNYLILHNLFRDQLDRYGEIDTTIKKWQKAIDQNLPKDCTLIINADDPNLAHLGQTIQHNKTVYYGIDYPPSGTTRPISTVDAYLSPVSHKPLNYSEYYLSHLGNYSDPNSSFKRPALDTRISHLTEEEIGQSHITFDEDTEKKEITLLLPGIYNAYNALAAFTWAKTANIPNKAILDGLKQPAGAFGRFEKIIINNREITLCLIKNPAGATEILRTISNQHSKYDLCLVVNDNFADGLDVSWYWDTPFELIAPQINRLFCLGTRAKDMALRLKYAGYEKETAIISSLDELFLSLSDRPAYLLTTYTASIDVQKYLRRKGLKKSTWSEE